VEVVGELVLQGALLVIAAVGIVAEVGVLEGVGMCGVAAGTGSKFVELVSGVQQIADK
jgi:hypothetical protein